ncbi:hypothetical protein BH10PLA2_BH10PLA2_35050 [soil metagenome]
MSLFQIRVSCPGTEMSFTSFLMLIRELAQFRFLPTALSLRQTMLAVLHAKFLCFQLGYLTLQSAAMIANQILEILYAVQSFIHFSEPNRQLAPPQSGFCEPSLLFPMNFEMCGIHC